MPATAFARSDLFSQVKAAEILDVRRQTVADLVAKRGIATKSDPTRNGKLLDRDDIDRIAEALGISLDWDSIHAA